MGKSTRDFWVKSIIFKLKLLFLVFCLFSNKRYQAIGEETKNLNVKNSIVNLNSSLKRNLKDNDFSKKFEENNNKYLSKNLSKFINYEVKAVAKAVSINNIIYPDISNYVPNGFVETPHKIFTFSSRGISRTRFCDGDFSSCIDGVLDIDFNLINLENYSFNPKVNLQSLSDRGTKFGEGISLGFKYAKSLLPNWSVAIGGENIIHLDETIDLGRNFYFVASTFMPLSNKDEKIHPILFLNGGIGSDFYGYKGNGFLGTTSCFGKSTLTGGGTNNCNWGPIGSIALVSNENFSLISEWFGYGYGSGFSIKPFKNKSIIFSFFATDFIQGFPAYVSEGCPKNICSTRFYGNLSLTF